MSQIAPKANSKRRVSHLSDLLPDVQVRLPRESAEAEALGEGTHRLQG